MPNDTSSDQPPTTQAPPETAAPVQGEREQKSVDQVPSSKGRAHAQAVQDKVAGDQLALLAKGLKTIDTFSLFSEEEIRTHLLPVCTVKSFKAGEVIVKDGAKGPTFFIICGHVKAVKRGVTVFQMQRRGDIFREEAAIDGSPAPSTIIAVKDTTCLAMVSGFMATLKENTHEKLYGILYRVFSEKLVERLQEANAMVLKLKEENFRLKTLVEAGDILASQTAE